MTEKVRVSGSRKTIVWTVAAICILESLVKGWGTLIYAPIAALAVPSYIVLEFVAYRHQKGRYGAVIKILSCFLTAVMLTLFVAAVSFGDTQDVTLFGVYDTTLYDPLTDVSNAVSMFGYYAILPTFLLLIGLLLASKYQSKRQSQPSD